MFATHKGAKMRFSLWRNREGPLVAVNMDFINSTGGGTMGEVQNLKRFKAH